MDLIQISFTDSDETRTEIVSKAALLEYMNDLGLYHEIQADGQIYVMGEYKDVSLKATTYAM